VPEVVASLASREQVLYAEPNYIYRLAETTPNDTYFASEQWSLRNVGQKGGYIDEDIDASDVWDIQKGSSSVIVAVIDTGIDLEHTDVRTNVWTNPDEVPGNENDDDNNGYIDDWRGWDFFQHDNYPDDLHSHGSHVSGIIGALTNNSQGVAGICWNVSLMPLACFDPSTGEAPSDTLAEAVYYAIDQGAKVINASWGEFIHSQILEDAIWTAQNAGALFIAAAGNYYLKDLDHASFFPAEFNLDNVIAVASSNTMANISTFSNQGASSVDLFAPGESIFSLSKDGGYTFKNGTSMAAPHVSGAAALVLSQFPEASFSQVKGRILGCVDQKTDYLDRVATGGRLNVNQMFEIDVTPPSAVTDLSALWIASDGITVQFTAPGDDGLTGNPSGFELRYSKTPISDSNWSQASVAQCVPRLGAKGTTQKATIRDLDFSTPYSVAVKVYDNVGNYSSLSNVLSLTTKGAEVLWSDDAETDTGNLIPSADARWVRSNVDSHGGDYSWTESPSGTYGPSVTTTLTSKVFSLEGKTGAWIDFYHWYEFEEHSTNFPDGGELQVCNTPDGDTWTTVVWFEDTFAPWHRTAVPLGEYDGDGTVSIRFRFHSDSFSNLDGWFIDNVRVYVPERVCWPEDIILESRLSFNDVATPERFYYEANPEKWFDSSSKAWRYGLRSSRARSRNTDTEIGFTATFIPYFPISGTYQVYGIWGEMANAENVRYAVHTSQGLEEAFVTQDPWINSNQWVLIGTYSFDAGRNETNGSIQIDDSTVTGKPISSTQGRVYADAVRCVLVSPRRAVSGNFLHVLGQ